MYYKLAFKYFLVCVISIIVIVVGSIWVIDPLQLFHKSIIKPGQYMMYAPRSANYGVIKYEDFNNAILGTSMVSNMSAKQASDKIGGEFVNISMLGSSFYERKLVLMELLKHKKIDNIIYSLDPYYDDIRLTPEKSNTFQIKQMENIYTGGNFGKFRVYLQSNYLNYLLAPLVPLGKKYAFTGDLDRPKAWCLEQKYAKRFGGFENWLKDANSDYEKILKLIKDSYLASLSKDKKTKIKNIDYDKKRKYINECLIDAVRKYPDTQFHIVIPPYSMLDRALNMHQDSSSLDETEVMTTYLVKLSGELPNMKVYGFDDEDFVMDIKNYKDLGHYKPTMDSYMVDCIANNQNILTSKNVHKYYANLRRRALAFDIKPYYEAIINKEELK